MTFALVAALLSVSPVHVEFDGELKEAIQEIAQAGKLNVIVSGDLKQQVEVHLAEVSPEEALLTLGKVYHLDIEREGALWVIRPGGAAAPAPTVAPVVPVVPVVPPTAAKTEQPEPTGSGVTIPASTTVETATSFNGPLVIEAGAVVEGDAVAFLGDLFIRDGARIDGDAVAIGGRVIREPSAEVKGEEIAISISNRGIVRVLSDRAMMKRASEKHLEATEHRDAGWSVAGFLSAFAVLFGLGFSAVMFAPNRAKYLAATIRAEPVKNGIIGLLAAFALIPVTIVLCVTGIGIPVAMALWLLLLIALPVTFALVANILGSIVPLGSARRNQALALTIGSAGVLLVLLLPGVGVVTWTAISFVALGALVRTRGGQPPRGAPLPDLGPVERLGS